MKKLLVALILAVVLTMTLVTPAFAGPPPHAGQGTVGNDGLWNAWWNKYVNPHGYNSWAKDVIYKLWQVGPPMYWAPAKGHNK